MDIVSLDRDQQEFYAAYADVARIQEDCFDYGQHVLDSYDALHERADGVYRRVEKVDKLMNERYGEEGIE